MNRINLSSCLSHSTSNWFRKTLCVIFTRNCFCFEAYILQFMQRGSRIKLCFAFERNTIMKSISTERTFLNQDEICLLIFLRSTFDKLPVKFISVFWIKYNIYEVFYRRHDRQIVLRWEFSLLSAGDLTSCLCI